MLVKVATDDRWYFAGMGYKETNTSHIEVCELKIIYPWFYVEIKSSNSTLFRTNSETYFPVNHIGIPMYLCFVTTTGYFYINWPNWWAGIIW